MRFVVIDGVPPFLPMDKYGSPLPFEVFALNEFYESHPPLVGSAQHGDESDETSSGAPHQLPPLPSLGRSPEQYLERLLVRGPAHAMHVFARAPLGWPFVYECGIVGRPTLGYAFMAAFVHCFPPHKTTFRRRICYHLRCVQLDAATDVRETARMIVRESFDDLRTGRIHPLHPVFGDLRPVLETSSTVVADGSVKVTHDFVRSRTVLEWSDTAAAALAGPDRHAAKEMLSTSTTGPLFRRGGVQTISKADVRSAYRALLPVSQALLANLPRATWPAFSNVKSATSYVASIARGTPQQTKAVAGALMTGRRRPTAVALTVEILHRWTRLSTDWIRRLRRE